jgi:predicted nucleic acid-binding protein
MIHVLDSNIISYYLKGQPQVINHLVSTLEAGNDVLVAPIAYYEVKRGLMAIGAHNRLIEFLDFCTEFGVGQFSNDVLDIATEIYVNLRKKGRQIGAENRPLLLF